MCALYLMPAKFPQQEYRDEVSATKAIHFITRSQRFHKFIKSFDRIDRRSREVLNSLLLPS